MRSRLVVRATDCQCTRCNGPGFDPSIRWHSGIRWYSTKKFKKSPQKILKKIIRFGHCGTQFLWLWSSLHRKKVFRYSRSQAGMSLTKLSLGGNNDVIYNLFPPSECLISDILAGDGNIGKKILRCTEIRYAVLITTVPVFVVCFVAMRPFSLLALM
jgi:hypothetical protein